MNFLFSIILPVYNSEKTIKKCLNSIRSQNINDFELIIIDDNSSDKSLKIIKSFKPDICIGVGGFASGPLLKAATWAKVPTLIHESNNLKRLLLTHQVL